MLDVGTVAQRLGVCKMTVYRLIKAGSLEAAKVGKLYRIEEKDLQTYLRKARHRGNASGGAGKEEARGLPGS